MYKKNISMILERLIATAYSKWPTGTYAALARETGITARAWSHVFNKRASLDVKYIDAMNKAFPKYVYWFQTGKTIPEAGQTSPDLEQLEELRKRVGTDE
jgi:hypothetical protein